MDAQLCAGAKTEGVVTWYTSGAIRPTKYPFKRWHPGFGCCLEQLESDGERWKRLTKEIS